MLSLVNYGSSDDENEITDEEEEQANQVQLDNHENGEDLAKPLSIIKLPEPSKNKQLIVEEEDDDEFLHKKEIPAAKPPPAPPKVKEKVKIMIPKLSDFKDEEEDEGLTKKYPTAPNRKTGLLGMLPKPTHSVLPPAKPPVATSSIQPTTSVTIAPEKKNPLPSSSSSSSQDPPKKVGLIPYALMDHKKAADSKKLAKKKGGDDESDSDNEEESASSFFTFSKGEEDLPQVNEDEIKSLIARETNRIEQRKRQHEEEPKDSRLEELNQQYTLLQQQQQEKANIDRIAMEALMGGSKAKRSKLEDIQILDLDDKDVLPDREEWIRRTLSGETSYIPTGQIDEKGPALAKRKHQLSYLAMRAEKNTSELEAMWAANRQTNREARSKYGF